MSSCSLNFEYSNDWGLESEQVLDPLCRIDNETVAEVYEDIVIF